MWKGQEGHLCSSLPFSVHVCLLPPAITLSVVVPKMVESTSADPEVSQVAEQTSLLLVLGRSL